MTSGGTWVQPEVSGFPIDNACLIELTDRIPEKSSRSVMLLQDSCAVTRECLTHMLAAKMPELLVIGAGDAPANPAQAPDLIMMNIRHRRLTDQGFAQELQSIQQSYDGTQPVVVLSDLEDPRVACEALHWPNLRAYLTTSLSPAILIAALKLVLAGGTYMPVELFAHWPAAPRLTPPADLPAAGGAGDPEFTSREMDVLRLLREAKPNKIIAHHLSISENTAKVHVRNIMKKLRATNRTQVALRFKQLQPSMS